VYILSLNDLTPSSQLAADLYIPV